MNKGSSVKMPLRNGNVLRFPSNKLDEDKEKLNEGPKNTIELVAEGEFTPPPWLFQHQDLKNALESAKVIDEKSLNRTS